MLGSLARRFNTPGPLCADSRKGDGILLEFRSPLGGFGGDAVESEAIARGFEAIARGFEAVAPGDGERPLRQDELQAWN